jgi:hypothetical protein
MPNKDSPIWWRTNYLFSKWSYRTFKCWYRAKHSNTITYFSCRIYQCTDNTSHESWSAINPWFSGKTDYLLRKGSVFVMKLKSYFKHLRTFLLKLLGPFCYTNFTLHHWQQFHEQIKNIVLCCSMKTQKRKKTFDKMSRSQNKKVQHTHQNHRQCVLIK